jgi:hypothetical protein
MEEKYWYMVMIQFDTEDDNGKSKKMIDPWLIEAISVTDAEAIANKHIEKMGVTGRTMEYRVKDVKETKITKVIPK